MPLIHYYFNHQGRTIDELYVDGVSITHSSTSVPRQYIWTLAAALDEVPHIMSTLVHALTQCLMLHILALFQHSLVTTFIVRQPVALTTQLATTWRTLCGMVLDVVDSPVAVKVPHYIKAWFFYKNLSQPVTSNIEVRVCADSHRNNNEDVLIESISLYVRLLAIMIIIIMMGG